MAGLFIDVRVDASALGDSDLAQKLDEVCPVGIFGRESDGGVRIVEENLDECVLCGLCIEAAPDGVVQVIKLYEE